MLPRGSILHAGQVIEIMKKGMETPRCSTEGHYKARYVGKKRLWSR
jgi:hypothetical protein